jgi:DNA polymerase-3 subunit gamma/tau
MSTNLALKYRPKDFEALIGQEEIVKALNNFLTISKKQGYLIHQVFLFSGERGTGKTTSARILSKALNCQQGPTAQLCRMCEACRSTILDIIEINAADNSSIEDVRNLQQRVKATPSLGRFKVYILDEIHLFSPQAFDALLKLLEEPPKHAIFILATTELYKIPETIKSRVHTYKFQLISQRKIVDRLQEICQLEGFSLDLESLECIGKAGKGSLRDAIIILSRIISTLGETPTLPQILGCLGYTKQDTLNDLCSLLLQNKKGEILDLLENLDQTNIDWFLFWDDLIQTFENYIEISFLKESLTKPSEILQRLIDKKKDLQYSNNPRIDIELILLTF